MQYSRQVRVRYRRQIAIAIVALLLVANVAVIAQPERAEALFTEGKALAASEKIETKISAIDKFDDASVLFHGAGMKTKVVEVELEHSRLLRSIGAALMEQGSYPEATSYYERALKRAQWIGSKIEEAFAYHDLGYISDQTNRPTDAISNYAKAADAYRAADDKGSEAIVLRNIGLVHSKALRFEEALKFYDQAFKIRTAIGDLSEAASSCLDIGDVYVEQKKFAEAIAKYNTAHDVYKQAKDKKGEVKALSRLGSFSLGGLKFADKVAFLEAALRICEKEKLYSEEAATLQSLGRLFGGNGRYLDAEPRFYRAMETYMAIGEKNNEAWAALDVAANYQNLNRRQESRTAVQRALELHRETKDRNGEAYALLIFAEVQSFYNEHDEAFKKIGEAKKIFDETGNKEAEYRIARAYYSHNYFLSNYGEAIRYAQFELKYAEQRDDPALKATAYIDLSNSYSALGQEQKAIELNNKALDLARKIGSQYTESICLTNIGYSYLKLENLTTARPYFEKAIVLMQANGYELEEGYSVHNLGLVYYKQKDYAKALASYNRALPLYQKAGDRRPESFLYDSYGELYRDSGNYDKAIDNLQKAVVLAREIRYSGVEAQALGNMMTLWTQLKQPRLAVLYGKQAVNVYQTVRAANKSANKSDRKSYLESNEKTYRQLANILIDEGRLAEAQQVLDLLKAEEYYEFVRRDSNEAGETASLALSDTERKALEEYSRVSANLTALGVQFQNLQEKKNRSGGKLNEAEEAEYLRVKAQVESAGEGLKTFFTKLASEFSKKVEDGTVVTPQSIETLKADLRRVGTDVVLVSTYLLPDRYRAIVTTGRAMVDRKVDYSSVKLTGAEVNRKIFEFQRALQNPRTDPRKLGKELYDLFVKPLEGDLRGAGAKTILWSLDGSLRYIPMAALSPDGKTYLADSYQNVVVTLGRQTNLFAKPTTDEWRAIGAGVSKEHAGFSALPSVPSEIGSIVREPQAGSGVLNGTRMLDEQFNLDSFRNTVPQQTADGRPFNVLHLATHFSLGASDQDSALLLGDGSRLSLFDIARDEALDFKDVELLTLSACQTAVSAGDATGREVESLGMLAQKKGAKAVLATLWKVADESTALFMAEFYRIKKANPTMNKAEAIRLAQKEMIDGKLKSSGTSNGCRSESFASGGTKQDEFKCDPNAPFSHPYFWSPFVLIGNWR
ncbi:MAG TPA: tetratricopeptide repeat protein [Pyrinomonadaceae bacterium]|nr:tetratricopeptide repeat protein [Pyrinomonadaceae bacterium]